MILLWCNLRKIFGNFISPYPGWTGDVDKKEKAKIIQEFMGDPRKIADGLKRFRKSALVLSRQRPRMIEEYPQKWVALFDGEVKAADKSFEKLLEKIDEQKLPRGEILVRFIDKTHRTMIL